MTSTTQEVTAEQIAAALGYELKHVTGVWEAVWTREDGRFWSELPYLEDSPEGFATLREFEQDCHRRGWNVKAESVSITDKRTTYVYIEDYHHGTKVTIGNWQDKSTPRAAWTAWYRAVQAQEG